MTSTLKFELLFMILIQNLLFNILLKKNQNMTKPDNQLRSFITNGSIYLKAIDSSECIIWQNLLKTNNACMMTGLATGTLTQNAMISILLLPRFIPMNISDKITIQMILWTLFIVKYSNSSPFEYIFNLLFYKSPDSPQWLVKKDNHFTHLNT